MMKLRLLDRLGWVVEKLLIWAACVAFSGIFLINELILKIRSNYNSLEIHLYLLKKYDQLIITPNNIGTITTIAAVLVGIYVTVLSVLESIKINSMIAFLDSHDIKKLIKYIRSALIGAFVMIFYSFLLSAFPSVFVRSFLMFLFLIYMLLTALRFAFIILAIYSHDLNKLIDNLAEEKEDKNKHDHIMYQLGEFLKQRENELLLQRSTEMAKVLGMERKQEK